MVKWKIKKGSEGRLELVATKILEDGAEAIVAGCSSGLDKLADKMTKELNEITPTSKEDSK